MSIQFHETPMGERFFNSQLPKLIEALNSLSKSIHAPTTAIQVRQADSDDFLRDLYYGNSSPTDAPETEAQKAYSRQLIACEKNLRDQVSDEVWTLIEQYRLLLGERHCDEREQAFAVGFRYAIRMTAAGLAASHTGDGHESKPD